MDWLTATKSFCALVEHKSFTQAANSIEVTPSAVSKRIDWLEKQLGLSLFIRTTRQVNLTEAGHGFLPRAKSFINQFNVMVSDTQQEASHPRGLIKIAATLAVGSTLLMPHIEAFLAKYPHVKIQLNVLTPGELPDLEHDLVLTRKHEEFDSTAHKGTKLVDYQMSLFGSPEYLTTHPKINSITDLSHHKMLLSNYYRKQGGLELENGDFFEFTNFNFVTDHLEAILIAAKQGMGLIFIPENYIQREINKQQLIPILPDIKSAKKQLWLFFPNTAFMPLKTRLFIDHLKSQLK
ncbi:LysR family transcriptional regulator [Pseudoalteromonas denitrificans]|uniref:DNA-binding transcriptional regulator, LysR family n=1 Tax=Pseudoalteromonas denitrificans DSM 6059 TaxID=1123010 RepID=A0A1I1RMR8_9GAMM|nr:LysR family transcriptional regulator [Pseudoalteromonas denitrificans]SFD32943.1 DNA-binding transcriptional regulator, LysR family [Pseudoalteromonas denitrificans DSM 6059]